MNFPRLTGSDSVASTNGATTATHSARPVHATCFLWDDSLPGWNYVTHTAYIGLKTSMPFICSLFHSYSSHLSPWFISLEKHSIRTSYCRRAGYKINTNTLLSIPQHQQNSTKIHQQPRNCGKTTIIFTIVAAFNLTNVITSSSKRHLRNDLYIFALEETPTHEPQHGKEIP